MTKSNISTIEKIAQVELKIKQLIGLRKQELLNVISRFNGLSIDNDLLAGFIIFALDAKNKNHAILKEFRDMNKRAKIPSQLKKQSIKSVKEAN